MFESERMRAGDFVEVEEPSSRDSLLDVVFDSRDRRSWHCERDGQKRDRISKREGKRAEGRKERWESWRKDGSSLCHEASMIDTVLGRAAS